MVNRAEHLVLAELTDAPIWKGTTAKGHVMSATEVCVDRTYGKKPFFSNSRNAGFVVVTFPDGSLGEPQDGTCEKEGAVPPAQPTSVAVPTDMQDDPGLLVSTDFGQDWPLTVPYGVVTCEDDAVIFAAPDGARYAVNGTALTFTDLPKINPIWKPDPDVKGLKIDISPVIDRGLTLC